MSRQIDVQGLEIFRQLAIFMSHLRVITRWSAAITKVPSTPEILTGTQECPPPSLLLSLSPTFLETEVSCQLIVGTCHEQ